MSDSFAVTGGAGFIGSQVVRTLLARGASRVVVIDNLLTGRAQNLDEVRGNIDFHKLDIRDYEGVLSALTACDYVVHLAAIPSVPRSIEDPLPSHDVNVNGTFSVYRAAAQAHVKRLVFAGSSSAYGDTEVLPKVETMLARPKSPYAAQKVLGELYASVFSSCYGLETVSLRFFNVFGPRQDPSSAYSGVLSIFMRCILEQTLPHPRRWRAVSRLHLCRRRSRPGCEGAVCSWRIRDGVQRWQRQPVHAERSVGHIAAHYRMYSGSEVWSRARWRRT